MQTVYSQISPFGFCDLPFIEPESHTLSAPEQMRKDTATSTHNQARTQASPCLIKTPLSWAAQNRLKELIAHALESKGCSFENLFEDDSKLILDDLLREHPDAKRAVDQFRPAYSWKSNLETLTRIRNFYFGAKTFEPVKDCRLPAQLRRHFTAPGQHLVKSNKTNQVFLQQASGALGNNLILLHSHADLALIDALTKNIEWVENTFDTIYVESTPKNYPIDLIVLDYFICGASTKINFENKKLLATILNLAERTALSNCMPPTSGPTQELYDALSEKMVALEKLCNHLSQINSSKPDSDLLGLQHSLFTIKYAFFLKRCSESPNLQLVGVEPENYSSASLAERDESMVKTLAINPGNSKNGLFLVGSTHGIALMKNLCRVGHGGDHFVDLVADNNLQTRERAFTDWHELNRINGSGYSLYPGYGSSFQFKSLHERDRSIPLEQAFEALYKPVRGLVPLPDNMYVNEQGASVFKPKK